VESSDFFSKLQYQDTPLVALTEFLQAEQRFEQSQQTDKMRFVGYVLEVGYDTATIITSDPYKVAVGGIPRGSFLILAPNSLKGLPPHFTLLRVMETAPTPLSVQVQQTYFELHKKSMPELDVWTQSELQWGALRCSVLGMFYPDMADRGRIAFSGDVNTVVSAHRYRVYSPDETLLDIIVNGLVRPKQGEPLAIGELRPTENQLASILNNDSGNGTSTTVKVSVEDFKGARTAMFGKTRLGKSNVVKLLAQAIIDATRDDRSVGQLIFDINGEYANDNPQDGSRSIRSANTEVCDVYALTRRPSTPSKPLRLNFYENPSAGIEILGSMLLQDSRRSDYIEGFTSVGLPSIEEIKQETDYSSRTRGIRRILTYWAILYTAGFAADENRLNQLQGNSEEGWFKIQGASSVFDPKFNQQFRAQVFGLGQEPGPPRSLESLTAELRRVIAYSRANPDDKEVKRAFEADDLALFGFLIPKSSSSTGPTVLNRYRGYHHPAATDLVRSIIRDSFLIESGGLIHQTLKWLAYRKWAPTLQSSSPEFRCPHCPQDVHGLPYDADTGTCESCGGEVYLSDMIGFHLEMGEDQAPDSVASAYMLVHETLLLFAVVRHFWDRGDFASLRNVLLLKDGPLTLRGQYSKLVDNIRELLAYSRDKGCPIHMAGQEKTGRFVDYLEEIQRFTKPHFKGDPARYATLSHRYIREQVDHAPERLNPYGLKTNYGEKVFAKFDPFTALVLSVPIGEYKPGADFPASINDFIGLDRILATLPSLLSHQHEGALFPITLANGVASLSSYPSAAVLKLFAGL